MGFSGQINEILWDYKAVLIILICLLGQAAGWRFWLRRFRSPFLRRLCHAVFIVANLAWAVTIVGIYRDTATDSFWWTWLNRPAIAWQLAYPLFLIPMWILLQLAAFFCRRIFRRKGRLDETDLTFVEERRGVLKGLSTVVGAGVLGATGYGVFRQGARPEVNRIELAVAGLPKALEGLVIAQIADLHMGLWSSDEEVRHAFETAAGEKPHLVALVGDLVDRSPEVAGIYLKLLPIFKNVPLGVRAVLGNHDHYNNPDRISQILQGGRVPGFTLLRNQRENLPGLPMSVIGLDDPGRFAFWMGRHPNDDPPLLDFGKVAGPAPEPGNFVLLLNHRPVGLEQAAGQGCHLYLAGHTHGGQYQDPWNAQRNLAEFFYKYTSGLYRHENCWLNVTKGLAAVGPPFRLFAWPEVNIITLREKK